MELWLPLLLAIPLSVLANLATPFFRTRFDAWSRNGAQRQRRALERRLYRAQIAAANPTFALAVVTTFGIGHVGLLVTALMLRQEAGEDTLGRAIRSFDGSLYSISLVGLNVMMYLCALLSLVMLLLLVDRLRRIADIDLIDGLKTALDGAIDPSTTVTNSSPK